MTKTKIQNIRLIRISAWTCTVTVVLIALAMVWDHFLGKKESEPAAIYFVLTMVILGSPLHYIANELAELKQKIDSKQ